MMYTALCCAKPVTYLRSVVHKAEFNRVLLFFTSKTHKNTYNPVRYESGREGEEGGKRAKHVT
jgi:hypothetical protein